MDDRIASVDELSTPALVLNADIVTRNISRMAEYAATVGISLRPHTKTHKLRHIAQLQLDAGAIGLTTAKATEAEAISSTDQDILVAYPPVGRARADRLANLARDRTIRAAVDSLVAIEQMASAARAADTTVGLLVELDVGMGRTGVRSPAATLPLAQAIDTMSNLRLDGIMIYPGHICEPSEEQSAALTSASNLLAETLDLWEQKGLSTSIVSGGSTPTAYQSHLVAHLTEIRPGTYVFNDMNTVRGGYCALEDCAARILSTVISDAVAGQVIIDAGSKTLTNDVCPSALGGGFGHIVEYPNARVIRLSEEHGHVDVGECPTRPAVGDRVTVIPNHICPCVNLQDSVWWAEPNVSLRQIAVDARGKIQ